MASSQSVENEVKAVNLIDHLECQVCLDFVVGPIHSCKNGHLVCGICKIKISQCPTCEDKDLTVSWALQRILRSEGVRFPCRNKGQGCKMMIESHEMKMHLDSQCDFRPIKCDECSPHCDKKYYAPNDLFQHWMDNHSVRILEQESRNYRSVVKDVGVFQKGLSLPFDYVRCVEEGGRWASSYFRFDNYTFLCHSQATKDAIFTWITMPEHEKVANTYQYSARITSKNSKSATKQIRFDEIPVRCLQFCHLEKLKDSGTAATISYSALKFLNDSKSPEQNFSLNIKFEVSKCPEVRIEVEE